MLRLGTLSENISCTFFKEPKFTKVKFLLLDGDMDFFDIVAGVQQADT